MPILTLNCQRVIGSKQNHFFEKFYVSLGELTYFDKLTTNCLIHLTTNQSELRYAILCEMKIYLFIEASCRNHKFSL